MDRTAEADKKPADAAGRAPDRLAAGTGADAALDPLAHGKNPDVVWARFGQLIERRGVAGPDTRPPPQTSGKPVRQSRTAQAGRSPGLDAPVIARREAAKAHAQAPAARGGAGRAWRHRLQGFVAACAAFAAGVAGLAHHDAAREAALDRLGWTDRAPPWVAARPDDEAASAMMRLGATNGAVPAPPAELRAAMPELAEPAAARGLETAASPPLLVDDAVRMALIAAADPPYAVTLHLPPSVEKRDVARLSVAVRAWGFDPPEQRAVEASLQRVEVRFGAPEDRDVAQTIADVVARVLDGAPPILAPILDEAAAPRAIEIWLADAP